MKRILAVGLGGMIGALLLYGIYMVAADDLGLWLVNLIGSFLIGVAAIRLSHKSAEMRLFISTGLLGSFTTFSAFSSAWFYHLESSIWLGIAFAISMTMACVAAAGVGLWVGRKEVSA